MLELENITAGYGDTVVLRDVTLSVPDSTVVALLGPNGAGKTTLLRVASGLIKPMSGRVILNGEDVTGKQPFYMSRRGLCNLPEGRGIFPSLTVRDNLILQSTKGKESATIDQAVTSFPALATRLKQTAGSLCGGEQQMLSLVRTFASEPQIVVVDEASLGLAPIIVDRIFETLAEIVATGVSVLLVEQYVTRALALADEACLLNRGQVVFSGPADELEGDEIFERYFGIETAPFSDRVSRRRRHGSQGIVLGLGPEHFCSQLSGFWLRTELFLRCIAHKRGVHLQLHGSVCLELGRRRSDIQSLGECHQRGRRNQRAQGRCVLFR